MFKPMNLTFFRFYFIVYGEKNLQKAKVNINIRSFQIQLWLCIYILIIHTECIFLYCLRWEWNIYFPLKLPQSCLLHSSYICTLPRIHLVSIICLKYSSSKHVQINVLNILVLWENIIKNCEIILTHVSLSEGIDASCSTFLNVFGLP